jgi:L-alanine-DL-glutamate epimerase-like enolase superfamily enzyme
MRRLRENTDVRIAAGEMTRQVHELRDLITAGCVDIVQPDAALVGGITGLKRIAVLAQEHQLTFTPHTWTNGMGLTANAHLTAGLTDAPFFEYPFDPPEWSLQRRDFLMAEPLKTDSQGWINLDDSPGMGYAPDEGRLLATRIG